MFDFGLCGGQARVFFYIYICEERLDISVLAGHLLFDCQDEEVFAKQKRQIFFPAKQTGSMSV